MPPGTPIRRPRVGSARQTANVVMRGILVRLRLRRPRLATQPSLRGATGTEVEGAKKKETKKSTSMSRTARPGRSTCPPCP